MEVVRVKYANSFSQELLTVVVPIYNSEQYLKKCIESIIHQRYKNLDIILINDGSTDGSGELCNSFLYLDCRVRIFHQENKGLVASRKLGVKLAKGDLITFVDSDDWIETDMYSKMMAAYMEFEPDMVTSGITIDEGNKVSYEIDKIPNGLYEYGAINEKIISCMMYDEGLRDRAITSSVSNKIYKVDLLKNTIMDVDESITYGEDAAITYLYIAKASKIVILADSWYHYMIHSSSMVSSYSIDSYGKIHQFYLYMKKEFLKLGLWNLMAEQVKEYTKNFLMRANNKVFDGLKENLIYLFPFEVVERGSRVAIYGAGSVGISYSESLLKSGYAQLQRWIDKDYENLNSKKHLIESPSTLKNEDIDYVVIAIKNQRIALEVKEYLIISGIADSKIIWKAPVQLSCSI
jgi:glycosyltransferase involved in cell wall biosynthesis